MNTQSIVTLVCLAGILVSKRTFAQSFTPVVFQYATAFATSVGAQPSDIVVSDFNYDGLADIAVTERGLDRVAVYVQGATNFATSAAATAAGQSPSTLAAVSLTPNGPIDDLVVARWIDNPFVK